MNVLLELLPKVMLMTVFERPPSEVFVAESGYATSAETSPSV